jgi:hypothetical protein
VAGVRHRSSGILVEALEPVLSQSILVETNGTASGTRATEDAFWIAPRDRLEWAEYSRSDMPSMVIDAASSHWK